MFLEQQIIIIRCIHAMLELPYLRDFRKKSIHVCCSTCSSYPWRSFGFEFFETPFKQYFHFTLLWPVRFRVFFSTSGVSKRVYILHPKPLKTFKSLVVLGTLNDSMKHLSPWSKWFTMGKRAVNLYLPAPDLHTFEHLITLFFTSRLCPTLFNRYGTPYFTSISPMYCEWQRER